MATKKKTKKEKVWDTLKPPPGAVPPSGKAIVSKRAKTPKQHPSKVGYHGTDQEKDLSPEE
ncbi:MAG: hypothetical protein M3Y60_13105 [Bacteroidota bacterium]|nr:hypothetical protein [Bacteroidota bacterium]